MKTDNVAERRWMRVRVAPLMMAVVLLLGVMPLAVHANGQTPAIASAGGATAQWKLSPQPVLVIGEDGTPQKEFLQIESVVRTASGSIVVANGGSNELRVFNAAGKFVKTYGRKGSGPGEFGSMRWVGRSGDTLHLFDSKNRRISTFSVGSGFLKSRAVPAGLPDRMSYPQARYSNGDYLVQPIGSTSMEHRDGLYTDSLQAGVLVAARDTITFFGPFPFLNYLAFNPTNAERATSVGVYRFGGSARWEVWGNLTWIAHSQSPELVLYDKTGKKVNTITLPWPAREFDKTAFDKLAKRELAELPESRRAGYMTALWSAKYLPKYEPSFKQFKVDPEGLVWIERYHLDPATPGECAVMNRGGKVIARLTMPGNFQPTEIGNDYVLGIQRDGDGLETVAMYRIWK